MIFTNTKNSKYILRTPKAISILLKTKYPYKYHHMVETFIETTNNDTDPEIKKLN